MGRERKIPELDGEVGKASVRKEKGFGWKRREVGKWEKKRGGEVGKTTSQGCVAITSDNADVLCNEVAIGSRGGRQLHDCWILDLGALDT